jgi:RecG-like helicase
MPRTKQETLKELQSLPGVGPSIANDLWELGIRRISDLKRRNPEKMYERRCEQVGIRIDPCLLYVFRCAVYYASNTRHNPRLLKWWHWKD